MLGPRLWTPMSRWHLGEGGCCGCCPFMQVTGLRAALLPGPALNSRTSVPAPGHTVGSTSQAPGSWFSGCHPQACSLQKSLPKDPVPGNTPQASTGRGICRRVPQALQCGEQHRGGSESGPEGWTSAADTTSQGSGRGGTALLEGHRRGRGPRLAVPCGPSQRPGRTHLSSLSPMGRPLGPQPRPGWSPASRPPAAEAGHGGFPTPPC